MDVRYTFPRNGTCLSFSLQGLGRLALCLLLAFAPRGNESIAQSRGESSLSEAEVETIRDAAMDPPARVLAFQKIVETRVDRVQRVLVDVRAQGRAEDIHQNMDEISSVVNELEDNLDNYASARKDLRRVLPKLMLATDRWASIMRQAPENDRYNVTRKLALEAIADLKDDAEKLLPEQQNYFKEHPPSKEPPPTKYEVPR